MGVKIAVTRVAADTVNQLQDITTTDLGGLTPKAVILIASRSTSDGTVIDGAGLYVGMAAGANDFYIIGEDEHNASSGDYIYQLSNTILRILDGSADNVVAAQASISQWITNGVQINWDLNPPEEGYLITAILFAGSDLSAYSNSTSLLNDTSTHDVTGVGFEADVLITFNTGSGVTFGLVHNNRSGTITQRASTHRGLQNAPTIDNRVGVYDDSFAAVGISNNFNRAAITAFGSDGFTFQTVAGTGMGNMSFAFLALRFGSSPVISSKVYTYTTPTTTGNATDSNPGFQPQAVLYILSLAEAINTYYNDSHAYSAGISVITDTAQYVTVVSSEDGVADSDTQSLTDDQAIVHPLHDGSAGLAATYVSMQSTGPQLNWSDVESAGRLYAAIAFEAETSSQSVSPSSIASAESFGSPKLNLNITTQSITSSEAFGQPTVSTDAQAQNVSPSAIGSGEAFGSPSLNLYIAVPSIVSGEAFGTLKVNLNITTTGIASSEAFGTLKVNLNVSPSGIASAEAFGTATVQRGAVSVSPSGIGSAEAFGTLRVNLNVTPSGIASTEAFGTPKLNLNITPSGIASAEVFGTLKVNLNVSPSGIATGEAFGTPVVSTGALTIQPSSITSAEAFGTAKLNLNVQVSGIASAEAFGTAKVNLNVVVSGIASAEAFGSPRVNLIIQPSGIVSVEAFGDAKLNLNITVSGIASAEAFGTPVISSGFTIAPAGIGSGEAFGTATVNPGAVSVSPAGIGSGETFGTVKLNLSIQVSGITSGETFGAPRIVLVIQPAGVASAEAFGAPTIIVGPVTISPTGIASAEAFGTTVVLRGIEIQFIQLDVYVCTQFSTPVYVTEKMSADVYVVETLQKEVTV